MRTAPYLSLIAITALSVSACSSMFKGEKSKQSAEKIDATGPTVVSARANPETVELDKNYNAKTQPEVLAEVKDFSAEITDVTLKFNQAPIEVPMEHLSGTTWRAELNPDQVKTLAVGNQTTEHEATIVATDADGEIGISQSPVRISVKAPDLASQKKSDRG